MNLHLRAIRVQMERDKAKSKHPAGKHGKPNMEAAINYLHSIGKCGSKSQSGALCTLRENHDGYHQAQQMGGPMDGKVYSTWEW